MAYVKRSYPRDELTCTLSTSQQPSLKKRCNETRANMAPRHRSLSFLLAKNDTHSDSSSDNDSGDEEGYLKNQKRASMSFAKVSLNQDLVDAISRYSDTEYEDDFVKQTPNFFHRRKSSVLSLTDHGTSVCRASSSDMKARNRCFDYLNQAIDEAWARYCDVTSFAEDQIYNNKPRCYYGMSSPSSAHTPSSSSPMFSDDDGHHSEVTNFTEYETDSVSNQPGPVRLQQLKNKLQRAKCDLEDIVESDDIQDSQAFWKRWDMLKYSAIEMVEDDDDEEIIESTIEELEKGRHY